ncbi:MAG: CRTAC1 family protein [Candidatus Latescibacterota bacterium]|nr:CRTAC1 family protein [Candidatus Latescibacterota bacterium]
MNLIVVINFVVIAIVATESFATTGYVDVTYEKGIDFIHENGAQGDRYLPETYGSGLIFFDVNADGWFDLYFVNGGRIPGLNTAPIVHNELYISQSSKVFVRGGENAGVDDSGYGMGAVAADYDADGDTDLFVTNLGPNILYKNNGDGTFSDASLFVADGSWSTSAAFCDIDLDGDLDLYVANYLEFDLESPKICFVGNSEERLYCDPRKFEGQSDRLYINEGAANGWFFSDKTETMGLQNETGKELGVIFGDYDQDGDPDLYLANDMTPNTLFRNEGNQFIECGLASGTSLNDAGGIEAGMGVDMADVDGDGLQDIFVTNFQWESNTLYKNISNGFFVDATISSGIHKISMPYLGFGAVFLDSDIDGDLDIFVANGHVYDNIKSIDHASSYAQRNQLLLNNGKGVFVEDVDFRQNKLFVTRGLASCDFDNDGDPDVALGNNGGPGQLLQNDSRASNNWIGIKLIGGLNNTDGIGALVTVNYGTHSLRRELRTGGSYLSGHDLRLLFGLESADRVDSVKVAWPGGDTQALFSPAINTYVEIKQRKRP